MNSNNDGIATSSPQVPRVYEMNIAALQELCGKNAQAGGWHEDRPNDHGVGGETALRFWQMSKIMLMVSELSEGVEELRNGKGAAETYYPTLDAECESGVHKLASHKPEGLPSELADTVIRVLDFCYTEKIDLQSIIQEKLDFNKTRGHKHGRVV